MSDEPVPQQESLDRELSARSTRGKRPVTLALAAVVLLGMGFLLGAVTQRHVGSTGGTDAVPGNVIQTPGGGFVGGNATNGALTAGTVERVQGNNVYVRTADGKLVKVATDSSTSVTVSKDGSVKDLRPGQNVLVSGTTGSDGSVKASRISEGAVPAGPGGPPTPVATAGSTG